MPIKDIGLFCVAVYEGIYNSADEKLLLVVVSPLAVYKPKRPLTDEYLSENIVLELVVPMKVVLKFAESPLTATSSWSLIPAVSVLVEHLTTRSVQSAAIDEKVILAVVLDKTFELIKVYVAAILCFQYSVEGGGSADSKIA